MEWTGKWLRRAAGWRAMKEGRALFERGAVEGFRRREGLVTGSFRKGKRALRTVVKEDGGGVEVVCQCDDHRRGEAICAHAVALVLTAANETTAKAEVQERGKESATGEVQVRALRVVLPPDLGKMLKAGKVQARIEVDEREVGEGDLNFCRWLATVGAAEPPSLVQAADEHAVEMLESLVGHSRVVDANGRQAIVVERVARVRLADAVRHDGRVRLRVDSSVAADCRVVPWGDELGVVRRLDHSWIVGPLPLGKVSEEGLEAIRKLLESGEVEMEEREFLRDLDAWLDLTAEPRPEWLGNVEFGPAPFELRVEVEGSLRILELRVEVDYGAGGTVPVGSEVRSPSGLPRIENETVRTRDFAGEGAVARQIKRAGFADADAGRFRLAGESEILAFLADELPTWKQKWQVRVGERLEQILKGVHVIRPQVDLGGGGSLVAELSFQTDAGKQVPAAKVRELLRAGRGAVKTANGGMVVLSRSIEETIEPLMADLGIVTRDQQIRINEAQKILFELLREKLGNTRITGKLPKDRSPCLPGDLRPYQREGVRWLIERLQRLGGALLADEMGLGKTIQTIVAINRIKQDEGMPPVLISVPTSLLGNWQSELSHWVPDWVVVVLHGVGRDERRGEVAGADAVLTSHATLARDLAFHLRQSYGLVVVDEASLLRNPDSEASRALAKLDAPKRLALSGTPVENRPLDLWSVFRFVAPGWLGARKDFAERYEAGDAAAIERLRLRVSPYVLRREKSEVAKDLPEKIEIDEWLDLGNGQRDLYGGLAREGLAKWEELQEAAQGGAGSLHLLTLLLRLRQCCLDPGLLEEKSEDLQGGVKVGRLTELLEERAESAKKTLVFSQFREFLRRYEPMIKDQGLGRVFRLDGSVRDRTSLVRDFQSETGPAVFLISLKAGGYGLNLTAADAVVHMDPWWNPAAEAQASDRAHRIGQTQPVTVYRLLARSTVEERVRRLQERKQAMIESIRGGEGLPPNWSEAELRGLLES